MEASHTQCYKQLDQCFYLDMTNSPNRKNILHTVDDQSNTLQLLYLNITMQIQ